MIYIDDKTRISSDGRKFHLERLDDNGKPSEIKTYDTLAESFNDIITKRVRVFVSKDEKNTLFELLHEMRCVRDIVSFLFTSDHLIGYPEIEKIVVDYAKVTTEKLAEKAVVENVEKYIMKFLEDNKVGCGCSKG